jgi:hypothetical protein
MYMLLMELTHTISVNNILCVQILSQLKNCANRIEFTILSDL